MDFCTNINPLNFIEDFSGTVPFFHIPQYTDGLLQLLDKKRLESI